MSNIVTFLFTDIEGSTRLWEEQPEAMQAALERHDRRARRIIAKYGGKVFKTVGDAFYTVFPNVRQALLAAVEGQRRLSRGSDRDGVPLRVRMGIHTGEAQERDGDYFGASVNRVARVVGLGNGGQILLTRQARENLMLQPLVEGISIEDLGIHRLRDLAQPEHVFEAIVTGMRSESPLKSLSSYPHNLPVQISSFVGRDRELEDCRKLVRDHRLLTLTGFGGSGKTRLALQLAGDLLGPDGAFLVEFASINAPALVPQRIAQALDVKEAPDRPLLDVVAEHLRNRRTLLVLDNCEHLIEAAADAVHHLLIRCPLLKVIVTSRETLGLSGEMTYIVPPLDVPMSDIPSSLDELIQFESVRLFVDRASGTNPSFALTNANSLAVFEICKGLEGVPLAIELAAARVRLMSAEQIAERLDDRFKLLTGGARTSLPRQQTLRALIDWSYNLLSAKERVLLDRLSVFIGGWDIEAVEDVCGGEGLPVEEVFEALSRLVDKSLVQYEEWPEEGVRYRLLGTIRQYALQHLEDRGETGLMRSRHLKYFANLADRGAEDIRIGEAAWIRRIQREHDNLRFALDFETVDRQALANQLRLASALTVFWANRGHLTEGRRRFESVLQKTRALPREMRAPALLGAAVLNASQKQYEVALDEIGEAVGIWREHSDVPNLAHGLLVLGNILIQVGDFKGASSAYEEGNALRIELHDRRGLAVPLNNLGYIAVQMGDYERAIPLIEESIAICREFESKQGLIAATHSLAVALQRQGDLDRAMEVVQESLLLAWELGHLVPVALRLETTAFILADKGYIAEGLILVAAADALRMKIQQPIPALEVEKHGAALSQMRASIGEGAFSANYSTGLQLMESEAVDMALKAKAIST